MKYEATVGAGLPIIDTYHKLVETGDRVLRIEGCVSGTLMYVVVGGVRRASRSRRPCARRWSAATPSPIRATICPGAMRRARG